MLNGPLKSYIYDIQEKCPPIFAPHSPAPPRYSVRPNGSELGKAPHPWTSKARLPTTPSPIHFGILAKNWNAEKKTKMLSNTMFPLYRLGFTLLWNSCRIGLLLPFKTNNSARFLYRIAFKKQHLLDLFNWIGFVSLFNLGFGFDLAWFTLSMLLIGLEGLRDLCLWLFFIVGLSTCGCWYVNGTSFVSTDEL